MSVPIVIIFFNRIEPLKVLVERLSKVKPRLVYLISDGPRDNKIGEASEVQACREFMSALPWKCDIYKNFAEKNLGCRRRVISGLDWVFSSEEQAIILEDDCIPELEFFSFMEQSLLRYRDSDDVISVGATNYCPSRSPKDVDVLFSKYPVSTGWGTWREKWRLMDRDLLKLEDAKANHCLRNWLGSWRAEFYWLYILKKKPSSWAYRWAFTAFYNKMYCALSTENLISNVGMGDARATNTNESDVMGFPHSNSSWCFRNRIPEEIYHAADFDRYMEDVRFSKSIANRINWLFRKCVKVCKSRLGK